MKKKKWYLIGTGGAAFILLIIACVNVPFSTPVCVTLTNMFVFYLICDRLCHTPCRAGCEIYGW